MKHSPLFHPIVLIILLGFSFPVIPSTETSKHSKNETNQLQEDLEELVEARGIPLPNGIPKVEITDVNLQQPAAALLGENKLLVHPKTIDVCKEFGIDYINVVGIILGHELVHFYQQSECRFTHRPVGRDSLEYEADWQGLFNAYLAGYSFKGDEGASLVHRLIDRLYTVFELEDRLPGYPDKARRQAMAEETEQKINELTMLFEAGNYAVLRGSFQVAIEIYEHLLLHLDAVQLHQNLSVAYASLYKQLNNDQFSYPFELNTDFRLYAEVRGEEVGIPKDSVRARAIRHHCKGWGSSNDVLLFEAAMSTIGGNFQVAKRKLAALNDAEYSRKKKQIERIIEQRMLGERSDTRQMPASKILNPSSCGQTRKYLDNFPPTQQLSSRLFASFHPKEGIVAVRVKEQRLTVQVFDPKCVKSGYLESDYEIEHNKGDFYIFLGASMVFTEEYGSMTKAAWVWPSFPQND